MERLGTTIFSLLITLFLVSLALLIFAGEALDKAGIHGFVFFLCYSTGIPSLLSPLILFSARRKE